MIDRLLWIETENTEPYKNLAMEEYLTLHGPKGACILFLWQNRHTVVIGKNQNCWKECRVEELEKDGGFLARRPSGGGAVFHDLGNLNFSFIADREDYRVDRQLDVILEAVRMAGIRAEKTGRNDIAVDGKKFSGNAFNRMGGRCCHHGTLMIHADREAMSRYLSVSQDKLASKGVSSVKSRVTNLDAYCPGLTVERMKEYLVSAFEHIYGQKAEQVREESLPGEEIAALRERFASWEWKYGRRIPFSREIDGRYSWGGIQIQLAVNEGRIVQVQIFSDAMEQELAPALEMALKGCPYRTNEMEERAAKAVRAVGEETAIPPQMEEDIRQLMQSALECV